MSSEDKKSEANKILSTCLSENNRELSKIMSNRFSLKIFPKLNMSLWKNANMLTGP